MDVQSRWKNNHSGQEVHSVVHLCPKCGWPYPNPHPSARLRRSHNRVCGTVEGYKLTDDSGSHSNVPEDDQYHDHEHSDEEHRTPGSKVLERSLDDDGSKEITERPDGSKEEAFLDAATHFPDGAPTPRVEASSFTVIEAVGDDNKNLVVDLNGLQAHEDGTANEEFGKKTSASSNSSMQNLPEPKNDSQELSDPKVKKPSTGTAEQGEKKFVEAPDDFLDQSNGVAAPSSLDVGFDTPIDSSAEADVPADSEVVNEQIAEDSVKEGDIIANENTQPISSLPTKDADVNFASVPSEVVASMEEGKIDAISSSYQSGTLDSVCSGTFSADNLQEDKNFQTYVVPKDIPVVEHPERLIEGYKTYSVLKLHLPEDMALSDTILQKEDSFVPVSEENSLSEIEMQKENSEVPSSDSILPKDKSELDDDLKELKEDVPIIQEVVTCEQTVTSNKTNGDHAFKSQNLEAKVTDQHLSTVDSPVDSSISVFCEIEAPEISKDTGENNLSESDEKHCSIAPEILVQQNEVQDKSVTDLIEVGRTSDTAQPETEPTVVTEIETREGYFEENNNLKAVAAEYSVSAVAVEPTYFAGDSGHDTANVMKDVECGEEKRELSVRDAKNNPESTIKYQVVDKEAVPSIDAISSSQSSVAIETNQAPDPSVTTPKIPIEDEDVDNFVKVEPVISAPERSIGLHSQTDSLEANWGSISVLSTQSDPSITTESELLTPAYEVAPIEAGESITKTEGKGTEKTEAFEAPSFMTLVERGVRANQTGRAPSQQEGKMNEEIISNQGAGKHHSPLKNLLVEATQESKLKSLSQKDSFASVQKDETEPVATVGKILEAGDRKSGGSVKEWDSPARYPAGIKREKRKVKGHWMPFICCSSVN